MVTLGVGGNLTHQHYFRHSVGARGAINQHENNLITVEGSENTFEL